MDGIPASVLAQLGLPGLVSVFIGLVFFGGLIPRWIHNKWIGEKNELISKLTTALDKRDEQVEALIKNTETLIRQQELSVHLLEEIKKASQKPEKADL